MSTRNRRAFRGAALVATLAVAGSLSLTGCTQVVDAFNSLQGGGAAADPAAVVTPAPQSTESMAFDSLFTYDGSVSMSTEIADDLELRLDVWAVESRRTQEWTTDAPKTLGYAINVYDHRIDEKAVLTEKRRVFISNLSIGSQTAQTSGQMQSPFQFSADPRTLVPTDTIRSDKGLLLNSFQGGLHVPQTSIHQLPADTYGITLEFAMNVWVEGTPNSETTFQQQTAYQYLPIAIFPSTSGTATDAGSSTDDGETTGGTTGGSWTNNSGSTTSGSTGTSTGTSNGWSTGSNG